MHQTAGTEIVVDPAGASTTAADAAFSWEDLKLPLVLPEPRSAPALGAGKVISHLLKKAAQYAASNVVLFCERPTVFAYFTGRSEPLIFETQWQDLRFLAERHSISILSDRAAVYSVPVTVIQPHLPSLGLGARFTEKNPRLEPHAILLSIGPNGRP